MNEIQILEHEEFVRRYRANEIRCHVSLSAAMHVCDSVKEAGGCVHQGSKTVGCLLPLVGIALLFFTDWWIGALCFVFGLIVSNAVRRTAGQNVIDLALKDENRYHQLIEAKIIEIEAVKPS